MSEASQAPSPATPAAAARLAGRLAIGRDGHESGAAIAKVPTGIGGFDHVAMGGLPARRTTVVAGPAGAAKTLFAAQFLAEGVRLGQPGVFVTLEEPAADLRANLATLGWDIQRWEAAGDWRFVDGSPLTPREVSERPSYHIETLAAQIGAAVDKTGAERLALDSVSAVLSLQTDQALARQLLRGLVLRLRQMGVTVVLTIETGDDPSGSLTQYRAEEFVADNVVLLRNIHEGTFRRRTVEVLKMRGAMHHKGDVPFTIVPGEGLRVLPVTAPPALSPQTTGRVSSGIAGLDELTHGGLFRGSTTLVSGPTGSGKTMVVTQFAADGLDHGETVLFMAYEESHEQVLINGAALGCGFEDHQEQCNLHVVSLYPEVASLDDHFVEVRELVERVRPTRLVLDGLSSLERLGSQQSYRGFLLGVTAFVRSVGLATFITASPPAVAGSTSTSNHVTGLVDTVIVLRHHESGPTVQRGIHIQRMRGSSHDNTVRELTIDDHGVTVGHQLPAPNDQPPTP
jgi:circadian clock protein KaiC